MRTLFLIIIVSVLTLSLQSCSECTAGDMRCSGGASQMCNTNEEWEDYQDCAENRQTCSESCSGYEGITCCR